MKRMLVFLLTALLLFGAIGCRSNAAVKPESDSLKIVTTIFPIYDWTKNVLGTNSSDADLSLLLSNGVDLHSFQPTVADIASIAACDLFVYVGGTSDQWVEDALNQVSNPNRIVLNLMEVLGDAAKEEELMEGMEPETDEEEEEPEYDEHVWLSIQNAAAITEAIANALTRLDPMQADGYRKNAADYLAKLNALDTAYRDAADAAPVRTLVFGDRFPFRYLTDDYGISYYAAFLGCSAETEASFETITFLARKVDELGLHAVLQIETSDGRIAETIIKNTSTKNQKLLKLDSMQAVNAERIAAGETYLSIMEYNLAVLKDALQ
jgi:zinc transport system substrate-binding protein